MKTVRYEDMTLEDIRKLGEPCYWGEPDQERYEATDPDEAIGDICDGHDYGGNYWPPDNTITIVAMKPVAVSVHHDDILEHVLEQLDEEYGDPDGDYTDPTEPMKQAAKTFAEAMEREYKAWICEEVLRVTVDVKAWLKANPRT